MARGIRAGKAYVELYADDSRLVRGLRRAELTLNKFGDQMMGIGRRMAAASAAILTPVALGIREYAKFEEQMAKVSTMVGNTSKHMGRLTDAVGSMAVRFGRSTKTLASGLYDILSAQIPVSKALGVLQEGAKAAIGGFTEVNTSVSALVTIMEAYGDQLRDAADASDLLFSIVQRGRLTYEDLAQSLGKVAPTASAAGVSVEEFGAALALITRGMPNTEQATTALARIIETFMKNTDEGKEAARQLGIEMSTAGLRSQGLLYVIQQLAKVSPDRIAEVFPQSRALRGLIIAVQKSEELQRDLEAMENRAGEAQKAYEKLADVLMQQFRRIREGTKQLGRALGTAVADETKALTQSLLRLVGMLAEFAKENQNLIKRVVGVVVAVGVLGAAFMYIGLFAKIAGIAFGTLAGLAGTVLGVLGALLSPVTLLIGAIAALGYTLYKNRGYWLDLASDAVSAVGRIINAAIEGLTGTQRAIQTFASNLSQGIAHVFGLLSDAVGRSFNGIWGALKSGEWELAGKIAMTSLLAAVEWGQEKILKAFLWMGATVRTNWTMMLKDLADEWTTFDEWINKRKNDMATGLLVNWEHLKIGADLITQAPATQVEIHGFLAGKKSYEELSDAAQDHIDKIRAAKREIEGLGAAHEKIENEIEDIFDDEKQANQDKYIAKLKEILKEYDSLGKGAEELSSKYRKELDKLLSKAENDLDGDVFADFMEGISGLEDFEVPDVDMGAGGGTEAAGFFNPFGAGRGIGMFAAAKSEHEKMADKAAESAKKAEQSWREATQTIIDEWAQGIEDIAHMGAEMIGVGEGPTLMIKERIHGSTEKTLREFESGISAAVEQATKMFEAFPAKKEQKNGDNAIEKNTKKNADMAEKIEENTRKQARALENLQPALSIS